MTRFAALVVAALLNQLHEPDSLIIMKNYPIDWGTGGSLENAFPVNNLSVRPVPDDRMWEITDIPEYDLEDEMGRSPYLDEVVNNSVRDNAGQHPDSDSDRENGSSRSYTQQYDARGHPINLETRYRERMEVQAGNEVLQVAGIVETCAAREEREQSEEEEKLCERDSGLLMNRLGHRVLTVGMWGVSGLRRRVILYELYSRTSFPAIVQQEKYYYGLSNLIVPGLAVETISYLFRNEWFGLEKSLSKHKKSRSRTFGSKLTLILVKVFGFGIEYARTCLQMIALLQQLNLIGQNKTLFPSLRSFIPLSRDSIIQFPAAKTNFLSKSKFGPLLSVVTSVAMMSSPITLVYLYGKVLSAISNYLFNPCYALALRPAVTPRSFKSISSAQGWTENLTGRAFLQALKNNGFAPSYMRPDAREIHESHAIRTLLNTTSTTYYQLRDETSTLHRNEALRILEGGPISSEIEIPEEDWDGTPANPSTTWNSNEPNTNNSESTQVSWASMISVEVVDHSLRQSGEQQRSPAVNNTNPIIHSASAELHDTANTFTNSRNSQIPKPDEFHISYLTMLPSILLARTLSRFLSYTLIIPLEILMIRTVASSYLRHNSLKTLSNIPISQGIFTAMGMPLMGWKKSFVFVTNLVAADMLVLGVGTLVWWGFSHGSMYLRRRRVNRERGPVEIEVGGEPY